MHIARSSMDTDIAVKFQQLYLNCCGHVRHLCVGTMPFWFKQWSVVLLGVRLTYEAMLTYCIQGKKFIMLFSKLRPFVLGSSVLN